MQFSPSLENVIVTRFKPQTDEPERPWDQAEEEH